MTTRPEDTDLLGVDQDYAALENELAQTVTNIESTYPGYDEYRYSLDEIDHNPYELTSYLLAKYHVYFQEQVQDELREIFKAQYELTLTEEIDGLKQDYEKLWGQVSKVLIELSALVEK